MYEVMKERIPLWVMMEQLKTLTFLLRTITQIKENKKKQHMKTLKSNIGIQD